MQTLRFNKKTLINEGRKTFFLHINLNYNLSYSMCTLLLPNKLKEDKLLGTPTL